jgi:cell division protein ZapA
MESPKNRVRVNIYGEEYTVRSEGDEEYIREVAGYVDRKMREIAEATANKSPSRVAILAALNITDEYFAEKRKDALGRTDVEQRAGSIITLLDEKLSDAIE